MIFTKPIVEPINSDNLEKKIERAYRICYKSEKNITDGSESLISRLLHNNNKIKHTSPLAHGMLMLDIPITTEEIIVGECDINPKLWNSSHFFKFNSAARYDRTTLVVNARALFELFEACAERAQDLGGEMYYGIWGMTYELNRLFPNIFRKYEFDNLRNKNDNVKYLGQPDDYQTFHIVTTRDILQEIARHTTLWPSVESTRYCDYDKKGIMFTLPEPYDIVANSMIKPIDFEKKLYIRTSEQEQHDDKITKIDQLRTLDSFDDIYMQACRISQILYHRARQLKIRPEQARMLLPGGLKTELILTGTMDAWNHFIELRSTKEAHPQMRLISDKIKNYLIQKKVDNMWKGCEKHESSVE